MIPNANPRTYAPIGHPASDEAPRKCGNWRFYREAGIAASGWCTHPKRGDEYELVLVRGRELACRDHRDHDLWEPAPDRKPQLRIVRPVADENPAPVGLVTPARVTAVWPGAACIWPKFPPIPVITERVEEVC